MTSNTSFNRIANSLFNPHQNLEESQLQHMNLEHCLTLNIN